MNEIFTHEYNNKIWSNWKIEFYYYVYVGNLNAQLNAEYKNG